MQKKLRIVALIDFSEYTENLILFVFSLAAKTGAEIHLLHQVPSMVPAFTDVDSKKDIIKAEKLMALQKLEKLSGTYSGKQKINYQATEKEITLFLTEMQQEAFEDWIILGLKGTNKLKRLLLGSTATQIVDETDLLCFAIPLHSKVSPPETLAIGIHYKFPVNLEVLHLLLAHIGEQIKLIELFTFLTKEDSEVMARQYMSDVKKELTKFPCESKVFLGNNAFEDIKNYMQKNEHTYLIVQQGSRDFTDVLFRKFMVNELVYDASIPLIILPK